MGRMRNKIVKRSSLCRDKARHCSSVMASTDFERTAGLDKRSVAPPRGIV